MTITLTREEAQQVLNALDEYYITTDEGKHLVETLRARLSAPEPKDDGHCQACEGNHCTAKTGCVALSNPPQRNEPEPVAIYEGGNRFRRLKFILLDAPLYTAPPQRNWQGLTHEEKMEILTRSITAPSRIDVAEAMLKEKNNG
jgi:hypothetical protein